MSNKAKSLVYSITINVNVLGAFIFLSFCKTSGTWKNLFLYGTMLTRNYKNALFVRNVLKKENPQVFHEMFIIISYIKTTPTTPELLYHFLDILQVKTTLWTIFCKVHPRRDELQRTQNLDLLTSEPSEFKKALFQAYSNNN